MDFDKPGSPNAREHNNHLCSVAPIVDIHPLVLSNYLLLCNKLVAKLVLYLLSLLGKLRGNVDKTSWQRQIILQLVLALT